MKKIMFVSMFLFLFILPSVAGARPGGLLDNKSFTHSINGTVTEGNKNIYMPYAMPGYYYYRSSAAMDITSFYITASSSYAEFRFFDSSGNLLYQNSFASGNSTIPGGVVKNVKEIRISINSRAGDPAVVYEFDVFGNLQLERPLNVRAEPGTKEINITWTPPTGSIGTWVYLDGVRKTYVTGSSYKVTGLTPDKYVDVQLTSAYEGDDLSMLTDPIRVTPYSDIVYPDISPLALWNQVSFSWPDPSVSKGENYRIIRNDGVVIQLNGIDNSVIIGNEYTYYMRYTDKYGRVVSTVPVSVTIPNKPVDDIPPDKPTELAATASTDRKSINISWKKGTETDLAGYDLYIQTESGYEKLNTSLLTGTFYGYSKSVEVGKTYTFRLIAVDTSTNQSEPSSVSIKVEPIPITDSEQKETTDFLLVTWKETPEAVGYRIYLNGRVVGNVGPTVYEFKITKDMGYIPGGLVNRAEVKAVFLDGSEGGSSNPGKPGGGGALEDALSFIGVGEMLDVSFDFLLIYAPWILLVLGIIFSPVLYGLIVKLMNYSRRKTDVPAVKGTVLNPYEKRR